MNYRIAIRCLCAFIVTLVLTSVASAASFDCEKASSEVEKLICSDDELSSLDEYLNEVYRKALKRTNSKQQLIVNQKDWLELVRNSCRNVEYLIGVYETRINELRNWQTSGTGTAAEPVSGIYSYAYCITHWSLEEGTNDFAESSMTLSLKDKNTFHFDLQIMGGNYHTCTLSGTAVRRGRFWEYRGTKPLFDNPKDCILKFWFQGNFVCLKHETGKCRGPCGQRASFLGVILYR